MNEKLEPAPKEWTNFWYDNVGCHPDKMIHHWKNHSLRDRFKKQIQWIKDFHLASEENGIKYTDMHGGNVMFNKDGQPLVVDFGRTHFV